MPNTDQPRVMVSTDSANVYQLKEITSQLPSSPKTQKRKRNLRAEAWKQDFYGVDELTRLRLRQRNTLPPFDLQISGRYFRYPGDDRSEIVFQVAKGLAEAGFPREQIAEIVQNTVFWLDRESEGKVEDIDRLLDKIYETEDFQPRQPRKRRALSKRRRHFDPERLQKLASLTQLLARWGADPVAIEKTLKTVNKQVFDGLLRPGEISEAIETSKRKQAHSDELFGPPDSKEPLQMEWLWYPYLPKYGVTILAGDPGRGKSMLIAYLTGIVTSGGRWPISGENCPPGRVCLLTAEDSFARVTLARLAKTGTNVDNLDTMKNPRKLTDERMAALEDYIYSVKPALVVVDTLAYFMGGGRDMHRQNEVGEFLGRLNEIAEATGTCILGLGHLNKQTNDNPLFRIVGSIGFVATVRSALFLGVDPADPDRLALGHGKASASLLGPTIAFERYGGGRDDVPKLVPMSEINADYIEICTPKKREPGRPASQSEAARDHILKFLEKEAKPWSEIRQSLDNWNIASEATFNAVRAEMAKEGLIVQVGKGPKAKWQLAPGKIDESS